MLFLLKMRPLELFLSVEKSLQLCWKIYSKKVESLFWQTSISFQSVSTCFCDLSNVDSFHPQLQLWTDNEFKSLSIHATWYLIYASDKKSFTYSIGYLIIIIQSIYILFTSWIFLMYPDSFFTGMKSTLKTLSKCWNLNC